MGTECQCVVRFMRVRTRKTRRLDLRRERCPPVNTRGFHDPGCAGIRGLFLGLFDVTRSAAEMAGRAMTDMALFGTVLALF